jgi:hypothetical protein
VKPRELIGKTLLVLYGLIVAAILLVEDGTALGRPGLTTRGVEDCRRRVARPISATSTEKPDSVCT